MSDPHKARRSYDQAKAARKAASQAFAAGAGTEEALGACHDALRTAEQVLVLAVLDVAARAFPSQADLLSKSFNRAVKSAVYWPKIVAMALRQTA